MSTNSLLSNEVPMVRWKVVITREILDENLIVVDTMQSTQCISEQEVKKLQMKGQSLGPNLQSAAIRGYFEIRDYAAEAVK